MSTQFTTEQLSQMLAEARQADKIVADAQAQKYAQKGKGLWSEILKGVMERRSLSSAWVGTEVTGMRYEDGDGNNFAVKVTITNVTETERRTPIVETAKAAATARKLNSVDTKALIKVALEQFEAPAETESATS